jgi:hypothetical protein
MRIQGNYRRSISQLRIQEFILDERKKLEWYAETKVETDIERI